MLVCVSHRVSNRIPHCAVNVCVRVCAGYVTTVLEDAKVYSEHAQKKEVDVSDVKLAVETRVDHSFTSPPPKEVRTATELKSAFTAVDTKSLEVCIVQICSNLFLGVWQSFLQCGSDYLFCLHCVTVNCPLPQARVSQSICPQVSNTYSCSNKGGTWHTYVL